LRAAGAALSPAGRPDAADALVVRARDRVRHRTPARPTRTRRLDVLRQLDEHVPLLQAGRSLPGVVAPPKGMRRAGLSAPADRTTPLTPPARRSPCAAPVAALRPGRSGTSPTCPSRARCLRAPPTP